MLSPKRLCKRVKLDDGRSRTPGNFQSYEGKETERELKRSKQSFRRQELSATLSESLVVISFRRVSLLLMGVHLLGQRERCSIYQIRCVCHFNSSFNSRRRMIFIYRFKPVPARILTGTRASAALSPHISLAPP